MEELSKLLEKANGKVDSKFNRKLLDVRMAYIFDILSIKKIANLLLSTFITVISKKDLQDSVNRTNLSIISPSHHYVR